MPIDTHSYLVKHGWAGKGKGLREGAISKPLLASQKKDLAGLGKKREDGFQFWDHLYSVGASSIQIKVPAGSDNGSESEGEIGGQNSEIQRTSSGLASTQQPSNLQRATVVESQPENTGKLDLMARAHKAAAKRELYSRFYRGEVLTTEWQEAAPDPPPSRAADAVRNDEHDANDTNDNDKRKKKKTKKKRKREASDE